MNGRRSILANIPPAVKGLLIINAGVFVLGYILSSTTNINLLRTLGLYYFSSDLFEPYQIVSHMFMHADFWHLLFNMYALWLFGQVIERVWGAKRFLIYYFITGFGAVIIHTLVKYFQYKSLTEGLSPETINLIINEGIGVLNSGNNYIDNQMGSLNLFLYFPTIGASGAVMGVLLAFGMLFPNVELQLLFIPIPFKAKYFVIGYAAIEMIYGVSNIPGDNIAHFAHLGGMLFGFILIKVWGKGNSSGGNHYQQY